MSNTKPPKHQKLVSVVVPFFNEVENVDLMYQELVDVLEPQNRPFELLFVDDGSRDGTAKALQAIAAGDPKVKLVLLSLIHI